VNKKNISLLIVRKSSVEIDWILPVIERMKKNTNFFTLFLNYEAYLSLKKSTFLYKKWKSISKEFYVQKKIDNIFYKLLRKIIDKFFYNKKLPLYRKIRNKLDNKIHNISFLKKKLKINDFENFHFILNEFQKTSYWSNKIISHNKKTKLFLFPHTTHIYKYDKSKLKNTHNTPKKCDAIFIGSMHDKKIWQNRMEREKIFITGHPKYDKDWQKQFIEKIKNRKKIIFAIKNVIDQSSRKLTVIYMEKLYDICKKFNYLLVLKLPPFIQEELNLIINNFKKNKTKKHYIISSKNIFTSLNGARLLINFNQSATTLDAFYKKVPVIQLPSINKLKNKFNKNDSIYTKLNFAFKVNDIGILEKKIRTILVNQSSLKLNKNNSRLKYLSIQKESSKLIEKIILNKIKYS